MPNTFVQIGHRSVETRHLFWLFLVAHMFTWVFVPWLVCPNLPLDVVEGYAWGREWLIGTYKHPPMQAWWLEIFTTIFGRSTLAHLLASQTAIGLAFWAVWQMGRRVVDEKAALIGVMLLEGIIYYNFTSPEFNPNVLQLPFWALICLFLHRAVHDNRLLDWALLGVWIAGGIYSKYSTVLLLAALAIFVAVRPETRRCFKSFGSYLTVTITALLIAPHVWWLLVNDFLPLTYAQSRMQSPVDIDGLHSHVIASLLFIVCQVLTVALGIVIFLCFVGKRDGKPVAFFGTLNKFDRQFLMTITFAPFLLVIFSSLFFGIHINDRWAMPFWNFLGLFGVAYLGKGFSPSALLRFRYAFGIIASGVVVAFIWSSVFHPYATQKAQRIHFPGEALAQKVSNGWTSRFHTPLTYVGGDTWPAGNVAFYTPERPHVFINMDAEISPWIDAADFKAKGGVLLWCISACSSGKNVMPMPSYVNEVAAVEIQPPIVLPKQTGADVAPAVIGWAIIPPAANH